MIRNHIASGLLIGLLLPFVGYAVLLTLYEQLGTWGIVTDEGFASDFRIRTIGLIAICLNVIPTRLFKGWQHTRFLQGLVLATFICLAVWVYKFGGALL